MEALQLEDEEPKKHLIKCRPQTCLCEICDLKGTIHCRCEQRLMEQRNLEGLKHGN